MSGPGGLELLLVAFLAYLPLLIGIYIVLLLRDIRSGIRRLNDRTATIEQRLEQRAVEHR